MADEVKPIDEQAEDIIGELQAEVARLRNTDPTNRFAVTLLAACLLIAELLDPDYFHDDDEGGGHSPDEYAEYARDFMEPHDKFTLHPSKSLPSRDYTLEFDDHGKAHAQPVAKPVDLEAAGQQRLIPN